MPGCKHDHFAAEVGYLVGVKVVNGLALSIFPL